MADDTSLPDTLVITLRKPIELGGMSYAELQLREPTAAEMLTWDKLSGVEADIKAVSAVAGIPEAVVRQIGARDLIKAGRFIASFLS